jgi:membrane protease YdiL (CAAX protease family)
VKADSERKATIASVVRFYSLAYGLSWLIWSPLVVAPRRAEPWGFLVLAGSFGPLLAAGICAWIEGGRAGLGRWLKAAFRGRIPFGWYLLGGLGLPLLVAALHVGVGLLLGARASLPADPGGRWQLLFFPLSVVVNAVLSSAGGEEPGWRGFALPRLVQVMRPLPASLLMGVLWGPWHLPLYLSAQWQGREPFWLLCLYCIPLTAIANWLTLKARRSALPAMLLHAGTNGYGALFVLSPVALGPLSLGFSGLKAIAYSLIALALIVATRGRLGDRDPHRAARETRFVGDPRECTRPAPVEPCHSESPTAPGAAPSARNMSF